MEETKIPEEVRKFFSAMGKKGGRANVEKHGTEHMKKLSQLAAEARKKRSQQRKHDKDGN